MTEGASSIIAELTKEVFGLRHLKEEVVQKHPMYPIHWGGYDKNIKEFVESEFYNEELDSSKEYDNM